MKHLYFCRHGESELNRQQVFAGQTDTPLTDLGYRQAELAGEKARSLQIDKVVASPLDRTVKTARVIARAINHDPQTIVTDEIFLEQSFGSLEGQPWNTPDLDRYTDIETDDQLRERAARGYELLQAMPDDTILLVGHGSFGRQLQSIISGQAPGPEMANADIHKLL